MALPPGWTDYSEGDPVPAGFTIFNGMLIPTEQFNLLSRKGIFTAPAALPQEENTVTPLMLQRLRSAQIGTFAGHCGENATMWIDNTETKFSQIGYPQELWPSEVSLRLTSIAAKFVGEWFQKNPTLNNNWAEFKKAFTEQFCLKDTDTMIAQELKKIKMTGTIEEYIAAYKDICNRTPTSMNFNDPSTRVNFYDHLKPYVMRHFNLNVCETLQDCFQEGKRAAQQADSLHANQPGK